MRRVRSFPGGFAPPAPPTPSLANRFLLAFTVLGVTAVGPAAQRGADVASALENGDWQTYSGTFASQRHSPLTEISAANVGSLRPVWMYQPPGTGPLE